MKRILLIISAFFLLFACSSKSKKPKEKTIFQTGSHWKPELDNRGDVAVIYGVGGNPTDNKEIISFEDRVESWRSKGYVTHFMTGIAWGEYKDYFTGEWDGVPHLDEGQVNMEGDTIWHGHLVPYIVPSDNFLTYLKEKHIKRVIDAGIDAIYMEEPEFWARAGYSTAFKKEWEKYYGFEWRPQHESPENTYLSNKLKYHLYYKAIDVICSYAKEYGRSKGMDVRCYIPTHSLVNYSQWSIVSPEASLASLPCVDGYIAQVWTGTSREPNLYNGMMKERVFETAYLEYGSMASMTAPTRRQMYFLTDPIEDRAQDWEDYKKNYQATFVAQLFYPQIADYEIMPWPERVYEGLYRVSADSDERAIIPRFYSTQMHIMVNSLNSMPLSDNKLSGSHGISVLMANSLMFQRYPTHQGYEDPQLANFYGLALPFVKRGVPISTTHIENLPYQETLKEVKVLLMTYANMKPLSPEAHKYLAQWVDEGGVIVYSGRDNDPFQSVQEWWNTDGNNYNVVSDHLFEQLGLNANLEEGKYSIGNGALYVLRKDPKEYVLENHNDQFLIDVVSKAYKEINQEDLVFNNYFYLKRGPYTMISVLDESFSDKPFIKDGHFIDLFNHELPIVKKVVVRPGEQAYYLNLDAIEDNSKPQVLASASRIYNEKTTKNSYSFLAKAPINTTNVMRVLIPAEVKECVIHNRDEKIVPEWKWDSTSKSLKIIFENDPDGVEVYVTW